MKKEIEKKVKKKSEPEKYFTPAGSLWIKLFGEIFPPDEETGEIANPEFWTDGSEKKAMKEILISLRVRAEKKNIIWTEDEMKVRLSKFILAASENTWLKSRFMLRLINQSKTTIFNEAVKEKKNEKRIDRKTAGIEYAINKALGREQ